MTDFGKLELDNLLTLRDRLLPKTPEPKALTLEMQQRLISVAIRLSGFIREIHYNHSGSCEKQHRHDLDCLTAAYKYVTDIGA